MAAGKHDYLLKYIPKGKERAISRGKLARTLNVSKREVSRAVMAARLDDVIIISDSHGYYQPDTDEELQEYYRMLRKRAITVLATLKAARKELIMKGIKTDMDSPEAQQKGDGVRINGS